MTNAFLLGPWLPAFLAVLLFGPTLLEQLARRRKTPANYIDPQATPAVTPRGLWTGSADRLF